jgi:hypothetical protein
VAKGQRRLHNEELHNLYTSPNIIRVIKYRGVKWAGYVARMGGMRSAFKILVGKPEGKRPLGRSARGWDDNIRMDLRETGWDCGLGSSGLGCGPLAASWEHGNEPLGFHERQKCS